MRKLFGCLAAALVAPQIALAQIGGCVPDLSGAIGIEIETNLGTIPVELYPNMAPGTVQNFLNYMDDGDYDGVIFHRSVPGFVVQAGGFAEVAGTYASIPTDPPITNEPCLSNTRGTIAMARLGGQPNSATSQWFINLNDNLGLDLSEGVGFTAFGRVASQGMVVADDIATKPIYDTLAILTLPFNQILRELPLQNPPVDPPAGYGCSRETPTHGLALEALDNIVPDPLRSGGAVVPILLDPQCTGAGATGPPSFPCTPGTGRDVFLVDLVLQSFSQPRIPMTCDAAAESEDSWAARRTGTEAQFLDEDIEIISVPEPSAWLLQLVAIATVTLLTALRSTLGASPSDASRTPGRPWQRARRRDRRRSRA